MSQPIGVIRDHVAAAERMLRELLLICPDPDQKGFEHREDEFRANVASRAMLGEAMELIEVSMHARTLRSQADSEAVAAGQEPDAVAQALSLGMRVGEETAARRFISRYVGTYYA